jgi:hypothetical protein
MRMRMGVMWAGLVLHGLGYFVTKLEVGNIHHTPTVKLAGRLMQYYNILRDNYNQPPPL